MQALTSRQLCRSSQEISALGRRRLLPAWRTMRSCRCLSHQAATVDASIALVRLLIFSHQTKPSAQTPSMSAPCCWLMIPLVAARLPTDVYQESLLAGRHAITPHKICCCATADSDAAVIIAAGSACAQTLLWMQHYQANWSLSAPVEKLGWTHAPLQRLSQGLCSCMQDSGAKLHVLL